MKHNSGQGTTNLLRSTICWWLIDFDNFFHRQNLIKLHWHLTLLTDLNWFLKNLRRHAVQLTVNIESCQLAIKLQTIKSHWIKYYNILTQTKCSVGNKIYYCYRVII